MTETSSKNGMLAVIQALAASMTAGGYFQLQGLDDLSTADFMKIFGQKLAELHGNMVQIEAFIKNYLEQHAVGTSLRNQLTTGSVLALGSVSKMLGHLQDYDKQIADKQKNVDQGLSDITACTKDIADIASQMDYKDLFSYYMKKYWYLGPATWATMAGVKLGMLAQDLNNAQAKIESLSTNLQNDQNTLLSLQKVQAGLVGNTTGNFNVKSGSLSGPAQAVIDNAQHIAELGLMFLSVLERAV